MSKIITTLLSSFLFCLYSFSQYDLDIEIIEIRNDSGMIMLQLFDEEEALLSQAMIPVENNKAFYTISDLKKGRYAVRYYHDENGNGKMETNSIGQPVEGYGFSNNVRGIFGPPPFRKWIFEVIEDKRIILRPVY